MSTTYAATFPVGANLADVDATARAALPVPPDGLWFTTDGKVNVYYLRATLTAAQITTFQSAVAATTADPNLPARQRQAALARLTGVSAVLRNQAAQAASTTVTSGNAVTVLQTVVNDLAIFCNRLADLIDTFGLS